MVKQQSVFGTRCLVCGSEHVSELTYNGSEYVKSGKGKGRVLAIALLT